MSMLLLAGCSSGTSGESTASASGCIPTVEAAAAIEPQPGVDAAIAVTALDDEFTPACVEVRAGSLVTIVVRNAGAHPHNLTLPGGAAVSVDAGQVAFIDARVAGGGVRFVCTLHEKMVGELRVVE